ncbi:MAG: hypothetical protein ACI4I9_08275 [Porcipelethomonas sp.]
MKSRRICALTCALACSLSLFSAGCGSDSSEKSTTADSGHKNVVGTIRTVCADLVHCSFTLEELIADSDFIAEIKVAETSQFVYPGTEQIITRITPEITEVYKGEYNGGGLNVNGGYMDYYEYMSYPDAISPAGTSECTEEELETAEVFYSWLDCYVPAEGETVVYFGRLGNDGEYNVTNSYQGIFRLEGENLTNQALEVNVNNWTEPLAEDLSENIEGAQIIDYTEKTTSHTEVVSVPRSAFAEKLTELI